MRLAQAWARLDQRDGDAVAQSGHAAEHAQRVGHQRAAPGPKLGDDCRRPAHGLPNGRRPDANQFAEHLADLGRGDEVAVFADWLPRWVIAGADVGEAGLHIVMHADRPVARDKLLQPRRKRSLFGAVRLALRAHHDDARAGLRLARQISHAPTRIMGME